MNIYILLSRKNALLSIIAFLSKACIYIYQYQTFAPIVILSKSVVRTGPNIRLPCRYPPTGSHSECLMMLWKNPSQSTFGKKWVTRGELYPNTLPRVLYIYICTPMQIYINIPNEIRLRIVDVIIRKFNLQFYFIQRAMKKKKNIYIYIYIYSYDIYIYIAQRFRDMKVPVFRANNLEAVVRW